MKNTLIFLLFSSFVALSANAYSALTLPPPPTIKADAYLLEDYDSGYIYTEEKADEPLAPASLTKMMTAYVVFNEISAGRLKLDDKTRISEKAWRMQGSRMFIEVNTKVSIEDLLKGLIIQSGNDAAVALAEAAAGAEDTFADLMNEQATRLGMTSTHYVNSTGLPDADHFTTARDLMLIARALIRDYPEHYGWHAQRRFTYNGINQLNRNPLLWQDDSVDGIKTGHTEEAGYCLVATAKRDDRRLISIVLGTESKKLRASQSRKLLRWGFTRFETHRLFGGMEPLTTARIWKGEQENVPLGIGESLYLTIPSGRYNDLKAEMEIESRITAPVQSGEPRGTLEVRLGPDRIASRPLIALETVAEGGLWRRLADHVLLMFD